MIKENEQLSFEEVLSKLIRYCNYQARSEQEVFFKANELTSDDDIVLKLTDFLKQEKYIDDVKFAEVFVKGKMNQKRWGKYKIKEGLRQKGVSPRTIEHTLSAIDQQQYLENLQTLVEKRTKKLKLDREEKTKVYRYLLSKGYESGLILEHIG